MLLKEFLAGASRNDATIHNRFWAEDLIYTGSAGRRRGKAEVMRDARSAPAPRRCEHCLRRGRHPKLKNRTGKDIWLMGGGNLAQTLFDENLIDEILLGIYPVLLVSGIPLFSADQPSS